MAKYRNVLLALLLLTCSAAVTSATTEYYPPEIVERIQEDEAKAATAQENLPPTVAAYILSKRTWPKGKPIRVAFLGGSEDLRRKIIEAASTWEQTGNSIKFEFGDASNGFNNWSREDTAYRADIRIAFGQKHGGYWSYVGTQSISAAPAYEESMNFSGFLNATLADDWKTTVIHEFGHALGFEHEHKRAQCAGEMRWKATGDGKPTVYEYFFDTYGWNESMVNTNLKPYLPEKGDRLSAHDKKSVMHYAFAADIFLDPTKATCYVAENLVQSEGDFIGAAKAYKRSPTPVSLGTAVAELTKARDLAPKNSPIQEFLTDQIRLQSR